jgi:2-hydroxyacyl-CoA lyase 1
MSEISAATVIAKALKVQGIENMFGIVGDPVYSIAYAAKEAGINYYGFRNEQTASYAAGAAGYLTGRPGVCLTVSGPGMIHAVAGLANAQANCWPIILLSGASATYQNGMGAFQESPQMEIAHPFVKYAARLESIEQISSIIAQAVHHTIIGRPGAAYIDLPADIVNGKIEEGAVIFPPQIPEPPRMLASAQAVNDALAMLHSAERPLVIVGKGVAYARAENEVRRFVESSGLPFLASPMGKGVVPDDHKQSVASARSYALQNADVIFLMGARLNWIMHFGLPPRFSTDVRFIQMDVAEEEIGRNVPAAVALGGDALAITRQLNAELEHMPWQYPAETTWWTGLKKKMQENMAMVKPMFNDDRVPMGYYRVLREVRDVLPRDAIIVSEGASTMDIGRTVLPNFFARHRLDAGTFGTMGLSLGQAIAAAAIHPGKKVVCVQGDSSFGFCGMEFETAARYDLPITIVIINNNGIVAGPDAPFTPEDALPSAYMFQAHYERIAEAFGCKGWFVTKPEQLRPSLYAAMTDSRPSIVNIMISGSSAGKPQPFNWLTR